MRDIVDICTEAHSCCGNSYKAEVIGSNVYVGNNLIMSFDPMSDDYAFTNAKEYAYKWNKLNTNEENQ